MELKIWLYKNNIFAKDFAQVIGYDRCYLSQVMTGKFRPSYVLAKMIERETGGEVTFNELMERKYKSDENHVALSA